MKCFSNFGLAVGYCSTGKNIRQAMSSLGVNPCEECPEKQKCLDSMKVKFGTDALGGLVKENIITGFSIRQQDDIRREGVFSV